MRFWVRKFFLHLVIGWNLNVRECTGLVNALYIGPNNIVIFVFVLYLYYVFCHTYIML